MTISQYDIYWGKLDPAEGHEQKGTRPLLVISSPKMLRSNLNVVQVLPLTSKMKPHPLYIPIEANEKTGLIAKSYAMVHQIRTVDQSRLREKAGSVDSTEVKALISRAMKHLLGSVIH